MNIKTSAFIGTSLDGYIARRDGSLEWLLEADKSGCDHGFDEFISSIDVLIIGRKTFEQVVLFDPWPYRVSKVIVMSSNPDSVMVPDLLKNVVEIHSEPIQDLLLDLEKAGFKHAYVDGGRTIQSFIQAGLLNEITLSSLPILIGSGIPIFGDTKKDIHLRHVRTKVYQDHMVQSTYRFMS